MKSAWLSVKPFDTFASLMSHMQGRGVFAGRDAPLMLSVYERIIVILFGTIVYWMSEADYTQAKPSIAKIRGVFSSAGTASRGVFLCLRAL